MDLAAKTGESHIVCDNLCIVLEALPCDANGMISLKAEKIVLQCVVAIACILPLSAGLGGVIKGADFLDGGSVNMDSHFRYLSGLLLGIGICFVSTIPSIEYKTSRFQLLTIIVFTGGLSRLLGLFLANTPGFTMLFAVGMELLVTPLLCLWQYRLAQRLN